MTLLAARNLSRVNLRRARQLFVAVQRAGATPDRQRISDERYATLLLHEDVVWRQNLKQLSDDLFNHLDVDAATTLARESWAQEVQRKFTIRRDAPPPAWVSPNAEEIIAALVAAYNEEAFVAGGVQLYLGLAMTTATAAGQTALQHLGINRTWAWADPRTMARDMFEVRGSKIIQQMYGNHVAELARIIVEATDPRAPRTLQEVKSEIRTRWEGMQAYQVDRIARTETAAVWTSTSMNAYAANGITQWESTIATGPSIGVQSEDPCDECVDAASDVHSMDDDIPPWHPNCRCEAVPVLEDEEGNPWLTPDEPWTGGDGYQPGDNYLALQEGEG